MKWQIEKVESIETLQIERALWEKLSDVKGILRTQKYDQLFAATYQQQVIGIGISWLNEFHPTAVYFRIFISDLAQDGDEVSDALFRHIKLATVRQDKWIWAGWESDQSMGAFLARNEFSLMRKTYMPTLKVADIEKHLTHIEQADNCVSLKDVLNNTALKERFFTLLRETYTATHQINPVNTYSLDEWEGILLDDAPDTERSLICLHPNESDSIDGYIMLHPVDDRCYEVGWLGERGDVEPRLLQGLFKKQLEMLRARGVEMLELEVDTTDWHALKLFEFIDFKQCRAWETYFLQ